MSQAQTPLTQASPFIIPCSSPIYNIILRKENYVFTKEKIELAKKLLDSSVLYKLMVWAFKLGDTTRIIAIKSDNELRIVKVIIKPVFPTECRIEKITDPTPEEVNAFLSDVVNFYLRVEEATIPAQIKSLEWKLARIRLFKKIAEKIGYDVLQKAIREGMVVANSVSYSLVDDLYYTSKEPRIKIIEGKIKEDGSCNTTIYPGTPGGGRKRTTCVRVLYPETEYAIITFDDKKYLLIRKDILELPFVVNTKDFSW